MESRTQNSIKNISSGLVLRALSLLLNFVSRYIFIWLLGKECLGLNGLFSTILSLFSLAELGIGDAITYYMYKPIAENNVEKLRQLISFYRICYRIIGLAITVIGICLVPFLPKLVNFDTDTGYNLYVIYFLYLANTVVSYLFFSYPQTVLAANQKQSVTNRITSVFSLIFVIGDICSLALTKNYIAYLSVRLVITILQNLAIYLVARKKYSYISEKANGRLTRNEIKNMFRDVYSLFVVKVSTKLIDSTDNIFISVFLGTVQVGLNSNYLMFSNAALGIINTIIYSFGASVGDLNTNGDKQKSILVFNKIDCLNFCCSFACAIFLFSFLNPFITLLWGTSYTFSWIVVALLSFNFYIVTSMYVIFVYRQSLGLFRYYKYNTLVTALTNIVLDFAFVNSLGVAGLYMATVISNLLFGIWPFIINVYKVGLGVSPKTHIKKTILRIFYVIASGACVYLLNFIIPNTLLGFVIRVFTTILLVVLLIAISVLFDNQMKPAMSMFFSLLKGRKKRG